MQKCTLALAVLLLASCDGTLEFEPGPAGLDSTDCASDTDGDAICDAIDRCLLDGPLAEEFRDLATNQIVTIANVKLDGLSSTLIGLEAGSTFTLEYDWYYNSYSRCCDCTTYISLGYNPSSAPECCQPAFTGCINEGHHETILTAPSEPGTYYIGFRMHPGGMCPTTWQEPPQAQSFAAICVN